jgi:hypothetical protein
MGRFTPRRTTGRQTASSTLISYGGENTIDLDDLDVQKTVDVNASRGVEFTLKPAPEQKPQNPQPPPGQPNEPDPQD